MSTRLTKAQRLLRSKQCAECDRKADATTFYPEKAVQRCTPHWVAYYQRKTSGQSSQAEAFAE